MFYFALSFFVFLSAAAFSSTGRDCSIRAITKNCTELPEKLPNRDPWFPAEPSSNSEVEAAVPSAGGDVVGDQEKLATLQQANLEAQMKLIQSLTRGTDEFKFAVSSPNNLVAIAEHKSGKEDVKYSLLLPWPPDREGAEVKSVEWKDFDRLYLSRLPFEERNLIADQARTATNAQENLSRPSSEAVLASNQIEKEKKQQTDRMRALFEKAKQYLIEEVKARPLHGAVENQESIIKKIESIKFRGIEAESTNCKQGRLNAYYRRTEHDLTICSAYTQEDDLALMGVLGHEIGHSIDPCGCRYSHHHTAARRDLEVKVQEAGEAEGLSEFDIEQATKILKTPDDFIAGANLKISEPAVEVLEEKGVLEVQSQAASGPYPFDLTYRCLRDRHGFDDAKDVNMARSARAHRKQQQGEAMPPIDTDPELKDCRNTEQTEMNEAMADVFRAKVLGRFALEKRANQPQDLRKALASFIRPVCGGYSNSTDGIHPFSHERAEKIVLSDPLIQAAFGCKETSTTMCHNKFGHLPQNLPATARSGTSSGSPTSSQGAR